MKIIFYALLLSLISHALSMVKRVVHNGFSH